MRISHRHHFLFLSYPRTASRSVRKVLDRYSDVESVNVTRVSPEQPFYHHMPAKEVKQVFDEMGWDWFRYRRFCIVRNPYERVVSLYYHHLSMRTRRAPGLAPMARVKALLKYSFERTKSFKAYVQSLHRGHTLALPLDRFILADDASPLVDDVLRYEELADELPGYLLQLGIQVDPEEIPRVGSSGIQDYSAHYDEETRSLVGDLYRYEIDRFGYRFEDLD